VRGADRFTDGEKKPRLVVFVVGSIAFVWALLVNGAIPFLMLPALGQPAVMLGYAQDFAGQPWYAVYAHSFGYPAPTGMVMGLPLAYVASLLLRMGMSHTAVYSGAMVLWLGLAYWGAWRLADLLGARGVLPALAAATWLSLPMVWVHAAYSSLGVGMALLPTYFYRALTMLEAASADGHSPASIAACLRFVVLCIVALFMDGYTFVMFAVLAALASGVHLIQEKSAREWFRVALMLAGGFGGAFFLYRWYMGVGGYDPAPMDFYRGWGLDLSFLLWPTSGWNWVVDAVGLGASRSEVNTWGDISVWTTTFGLPLVVAGIGCAVCLWRRDRRARLLVIIALIGLYFSLGPTLKFNTHKPPGMVAQAMMAAQYGWFSTKNAWFYAHLPGFRNMRASYRWEAMFLLGLWALLALACGHAEQRLRKVLVGGYLLLIALFIPAPGHLFADYRLHFLGLREIDRSLVAPLSSSLRKGERVLFLPIGNDAIVDYLSPQLHIRSFNVGGDKQLAMTSAQWPQQVQRFSNGGLSIQDVPALRLMLFDGQVDAVVIPYFDMLRSVHMWPCAGNRRDFSARELGWLSWPRYVCPAQYKTTYQTMLESLKSDSQLSVQDNKFYAVIRLKPGASKEQAMTEMAAHLHFPVNIVTDKWADWLLGSGWYAAEPTRRWSGVHANLAVPIPESCHGGGCKLAFRFLAFGASAQRPVSVRISSIDQRLKNQAVEVMVTDAAEHEVVMSVPAQTNYAEFSVEVPQAISPFALNGSPDHRTLGISLGSIDLLGPGGRAGVDRFAEEGRG